MITGLLMAVALAGAGDIHRCRAADGSLAFQDRPCDVAATPPRASSPSRQSPPAERQPDLAATPRAHAPVDERLMAACSERFLHCADGNAQRMDACIASIAPCSAARGGACCPSSCVDRYQSLRRKGEPLASAVRLALLDPHAPSCAAPGSR
ncbi:MAG TPA: hypothetical protein PKZ76_09565 [Xanthomonadaceae bacterium]|nr:hypothetical protein [Xanthomonadaceae bacterium]